jgi:hypothetical protein
MEEKPKFTTGHQFLEKADKVIVIHRPKQEILEQTAVEFLESQYKFHGELYETAIEQAKKIEKKQKGYSEEKVKQAITNFYMNDMLLTPANLTKVINDLKQEP